MKTLREIGAALKDARLKQKLTFEDIYKKTRIHQDVLKTLENGEPDGPFGKIYQKAFFKKYCQFLGLDKKYPPESYSSLFKDVKEEENKEVYFSAHQPEENNVNYDISRYMPAALKVFAGILIVIAVFISISKTKLFFSNLSSKRKIQALSKERKRAEKSSDKNAKEESDKYVKQKVSLILKASDEVWIRLKKDEEVVFRGILPKGSQEEWEADRALDLRIGKLEVLDFTVNGEYIGNIGKGVGNVSIDKKGIMLENKRIR